MKKYVGLLIGSFLFTTVAQATIYSSGCGPGSAWPTTQAQKDFGWSTGDMLGRNRGCTVVHTHSSAPATSDQDDDNSEQESQWTASSTHAYVNEVNRLNRRGKTFVFNTDSGTKFFEKNMTSCGKVGFANGTRLYYLKTIAYKGNDGGTSFIEPVLEFNVPAGTRVLSRKNIAGVIKNGVLLKTCSVADYAEYSDDYQGLDAP
jgi:hypothetical protein